MPIFPNVSPPGTGDDPFIQLLMGLNQSEASQKALASRGYQDAIGMLSNLLNEVNAAPGPEQLPVPQGINPLGGMAAIFASTLAEQLGARGSTQNIQQQMAQTELDRKTAIQQNLESTATDRRERQLKRFDIQMRIAEKKMDEAEKMGDIEGFYSNLKTTIAVNKAMEKLRQENDLEIQRLRGRQALEEIGAKEVAQAKAEAPEKTKAAEERELRMFTESVAGKQKLPGSTETGKVGWLWNRKEITKLTPKGKMDIQNKAYSTASSTSFPSVRKAAVMAFYDTFRDETGVVSPEAMKSPAWERFLVLTDQLPPEEAVEIYNELQVGVGNQ